MKKKTFIAILVVLLIALPCFAFGSKESAENNNTKTTTSSSNETQSAEPVNSTVLTSEPAPSAEQTDSTALSTPAYSVELTEPQMVTLEEIETVRQQMSEAYGAEVTEEDAFEYIVDQILFSQAISRAISEGEIPLDDGQFNDYVSYQLINYASQYGITLQSNSDVDNFLSLLGITIDDFAAEVLSGYAEEYYVTLHSNGKLENIEEPTMEEVTAVYNQYKSSFVSDAAVNLAHIYFQFGSDKETAKVKADTALNNINKGLPWNDAVTTYSEDPNTATNKGEFGMWLYESTDGLVDAFGEKGLEVIFSLGSGKISDVVEGVNGYHIFKVLEHKDSALLKLDDLYNLNSDATVADYIAYVLMQQKEAEAYADVVDEIITELKLEATIKSLI